MKYIRKKPPINIACVPAFFLAALFILFAFTIPVSADHCGGAALGHPGGDSFPCPSGVDIKGDDGVDIKGDDGVYIKGDDGVYIKGGDGKDVKGDDEGGVILFDPIEKSIEDIFLAILDIILVFAIPIILFFIVWAGFLYVTAQGSEEQVKKATTALTYAIIGGLLVLGAKVLLAVITNTISIFA